MAGRCVWGKKNILKCDTWRGHFEAASAGLPPASVLQRPPLHLAQSCAWVEASADNSRQLQARSNSGESSLQGERGRLWTCNRAQWLLVSGQETLPLASLPEDVRPTVFHVVPAPAASVPPAQAGERADAALNHQEEQKLTRTSWNKQ